MSKRRDQQHFRGCLIGGAIGDALGWPVEFLSRAQIREKYGPAGITDLVPGSTGQAECHQAVLAAMELARSNKEPSQAQSP